MSSEVVARYHEALAARNLVAARGLLRDDLRSEGPFDRFTTANDYWAQIEGLWNVVESVHVNHLSSDGDEAVVLFDMATNCHTAPFAFLRSG